MTYPGPFFGASWTQFEKAVGLECTQFFFFVVVVVQWTLGFHTIFFVPNISGLFLVITLVKLFVYKEKDLMDLIILMLSQPVMCKQMDYIFLVTARMLSGVDV